MNTTFITPAILQALSFREETPILAGSVVDQTTVSTTGQEVQDYDWSDSSFNHNWNDQ